MHSAMLTTRHMFIIIILANICDPCSRTMCTYCRISSFVCWHNAYDMTIREQFFLDYASCENMFASVPILSFDQITAVFVPDTYSSSGTIDNRGLFSSQHKQKMKKKTSVTFRSCVDIINYYTKLSFHCSRAIF